jgi:hypothetical protein
MFACAPTRLYALLTFFALLDCLVKQVLYIPTYKHAPRASVKKEFANCGQVLFIF